MTKWKIDTCAFTIIPFPVVKLHGNTVLIAEVVRLSICPFGPWQQLSRSHPLEGVLSVNVRETQPDSISCSEINEIRTFTRSHSTQWYWLLWLYITMQGGWINDMIQMILFWFDTGPIRVAVDQFVLGVILSWTTAQVEASKGLFRCCHSHWD